MITTVTSREFNQDRGRAKRAAHDGPVFVTDRGRPSLVLLSYDEWLRLSGGAKSIAEALSGSIDAAEIEFEPPRDRTVAAGAEFD